MCFAPNGLTPAFAGKTIRISSVARSCWAHPRIRGEDPGVEHEPGEGPGLTPAFAGKTLGVHVGPEG